MDTRIRYLIAGVVIGIVCGAMGSVWVMKEMGSGQPQINTPMLTSGNKPKTVTDEKGRACTFIYDEKGHVVSVTRPDGTRENYAYDAKGNVIQPAAK